MCGDSALLLKSSATIDAAEKVEAILEHGLFVKDGDLFVKVVGLSDHWEAFLGSDFSPPTYPESCHLP